MIEDGWEYEGEFKDNKLHGRGKKITTNKETYEGEFSMNQYNGDGKLTM